MAKKNTTTAIAPYDEELAQMAQQSADQVAGLGGMHKISFKGGQLRIDGARMPEDRMAVIILDHVRENAYYTTEFDSENPEAPDCYAIGRDEKEMSPHEGAKDPQGDDDGKCNKCPLNQFGSASKGRGKACRNMIRIVAIQAGNIDSEGNFEAFDDDILKSQQLIVGKIPPTSIRAFATYVKALNTNLRRPPMAVISQLSCEPDDAKMLVVDAQLMDPVDNSLIPHLKSVLADAQEPLLRGYEGMERAEQPQPKGKKPVGRGAVAKQPVNAKKAPQRAGSRF